MNTKVRTYIYKKETAPAKPGTDAFRWGTKQAGSNCPAAANPAGKELSGFCWLGDV